MHAAFLNRFVATCSQVIFWCYVTALWVPPAIQITYESWKVPNILDISGTIKLVLYLLLFDKLPVQSTLFPQTVVVTNLHR